MHPTRPRSDVGLVVPARLASSRLPRKMLAEVAGRPALACLLARLGACRLPAVRVLCTTVDPEDRALVPVARAAGWEVFRGDVEDVLQRYLAAAERFGLELLVNVDGDDLLCSAEYVDVLVLRALESGADYLTVEGLPLGGTPIVLRTSALREVCQRKQEQNTQGWGKYFLESDLFRVERLEAPPELRRPAYRLTLDYPEDLALFRALFLALGVERSDLPSVIAHLDAHPELAGLNAGVTERYWERFRREHGAYSLDDPPSASAEP